MNLLRIFDRHPHDDLSAHADGQLGREQGERLEQHVEACNACRDELAGLRALRSALSDLPEARAPRSFALTPEQVAAPARERQYAGPGPAFVAMRIAGAGVAAVLAIVVVIDSGGSGSETTSSDISSAAIPAAESDTRADGDSESLEGSQNFTIDATLAAGGIAGGEGDAPDADSPPDSDSNSGQDAAAPTDTEVTDSEGYQYDLNTEKAIDDSAAEDGTSGGDEASFAMADDNDGLSTLLVIEIALGIIAVGGIAGGFVLPLFIRKQD